MTAELVFFARVGSVAGTITDDTIRRNEFLSSPMGVF